MSLTSKWWLAPDGAVEMVGNEHVDFAIAALLLMPDRKYAPRHWNSKGVPPHELDAALARGADSRAVEFLSKRGNDARLWVIREFGWIRTAKNRWNLWEFGKREAEIARDSKAYWAAQYDIKKFDMIEVEEFKTGDQYSINASALFNGGNPKVLKNLAMGRIDIDSADVSEPVYSAAKYGELERQKLYRREGANPRRSR